jgi:hypothetical protein
MIRPAAQLIVALERECLEVDNAIAARDWDLCEGSWGRQRLLTHELDISLRETPLAEADAAKMTKRIARLANYREGQLKRLREFNDAVATRLATMNSFRSFSKTIDNERRSSLLDVTS